MHTKWRGKTATHTITGGRQKKSEEKVKKKIGEGREEGRQIAERARAMRAAKIRLKMQARNCLTAGQREVGVAVGSGRG